MSEACEEYELVIVGGGLVGVSLALALQGSGRRVALIEQAPPPPVEPAWDERCIGLNDATRRIFESLGVWAAMRAEAEPILATHVSERGRFGVARFEAAEAGLDALGYNTPLRAIHQTLLAAVDRSRTTLLCPAQLDALETQADALSLRLAGVGRAVRTRLLVAADGTRSALREWQGIGTREHDYRQHAIVTTVQVERCHRGIAHERFTPQGPIAVLPRPGQVCTVVWTVPTACAEELLALDAPAFLAALQQAFGYRLGRFEGLGRRGAYPLVQVMGARLTAARTVFVGNAAQTVHPVVAQGFNLGLRDVATLAELVADAPDPGAPGLLDAYAARRREDRRQVAEFTDGLVRLFSNRLPGLSETRHLGLLGLNLAGPLRRRLMRRSLGYGGLTPAAARHD